jgi:hypothetical protein
LEELDEGKDMELLQMESSFCGPSMHEFQGGDCLELMKMEEREKWKWKLEEQKEQMLWVET